MCRIVRPTRHKSLKITRKADLEVLAVDLFLEGPLCIYCCTGSL